MAVLNAPFASSMRTRIVTAPGIDGDSRDRAIAAEIAGAVVADVDLEPAGIAALETQRDLSLAAVPSTVRTPCWSFGRWKRLEGLRTAFPADETGSNRAPMTISPAPAV